MLTGLKQRDTRWVIRRRVPAQYVETWGSAEVTRTLGTSDYKEARKRLPKAWAALDEEFAANHAAVLRERQAGAPPDPNVIAARLLPKFRARRDAAAAAGELPEFNDRMAGNLMYEDAVLNGEEETERPLVAAFAALLPGLAALVWAIRRRP